MITKLPVHGTLLHLPCFESLTPTTSMSRSYVAWKDVTEHDTGLASMFVKHMLVKSEPVRKHPRAELAVKLVLLQRKHGGLLLDFERWIQMHVLEVRSRADKPVFKVQVTRHASRKLVRMAFTRGGTLRESVGSLIPLIARMRPDMLKLNLHALVDHTAGAIIHLLPNVLMLLPGSVPLHAPDNVQAIGTNLALDEGRIDRPVVVECISSGTTALPALVSAAARRVSYLGKLVDEVKRPLSGTQL